VMPVNPQMYVQRAKLVRSRSDGLHEPSPESGTSRLQG
jgi:hypothetical protein